MIGALLTQPAPGAAAPAVVPCPPTSAVPPPAALQGLAFLVGGTWRAELAGGQALEESCVWGLANQFILAQAARTAGGTVVCAAQGAFGWSGEGTTLLSWSFVSQGCYVNGRQQPGPAGAFVFLTMTGGVSSAQGRTTITQTGPDAMTLTAETLQGGSYGPPTVAYYRRC